MLRLLGRSSEVECNPKTNILFFDDFGGLFLFFFYISVNIFCLDSLADHQKLKVIQKQTFDFSMTLGAFFIFLHFGQCFLLRSLGQSSEVECNPKMNISFFWLERGGRWCSSPSTSPANHQKLNVIQKQAFQFLIWRGVADGV